MANTTLNLARLGRIHIGDEKIGEEVLGQERKEEEAHSRIIAGNAQWHKQSAKMVYDDAGDEEILTIARQHFSSQRGIPLPYQKEEKECDTRWSSWAETMAKAMWKFADCREVLHYAQSMVPFDHREMADASYDYLAFLRDLAVFELPYCVKEIFKTEENKLSVPGSLFLLNDVLVSNIMFWHMRIMFFCIMNVPKPKTIVEIGGGYGSLARLWARNELSPIDRYLIFDLPESLFFSEVALRKEFGDDVGYSSDGNDPGTKITLVPLGQIKSFKGPYDLVVNVGSMQEMSDGWVNFYMRLLDAIDVKFFYSLNYMGQPIQNMAESRSFWAPRPTHEWSTRILRSEIPLVKVMSPGRDFAEVLYEKKRATRRFYEWSVLHGHFLTRETYLEGLELLRQDLTIDNCRKLIETCVILHNNNQNMPPPKELLFIADAAIKSGAEDMKIYLEQFEPLIGQFKV